MTIIIPNRTYRTSFSQYVDNRKFMLGDKSRLWHTRGYYDNFTGRVAGCIGEKIRQEEPIS